MQAWFAGRRAFLSLLLSNSIALRGADRPPARFPALFDFHSGFWLNLHLTLYAESLPSGDQQDEASTNATRQSALAYYKANLTSRDLTFDDEMEKLKNDLEDQEGLRHLVASANLSPDLIDVLEKVAPAYRDRLWRKADNANRRWIAGVAPLIDRYGALLAATLAQFYQNDWPSDPIRVDVVNYANWAGAFTTLHPTRITVSSTDVRNQNYAALEILFHEGSHGIIGKLRNVLESECKRQQVRLPGRDLWHAVLFYSTGEAVLRAIPGYVPYAEANGLWRQRPWYMYSHVLQRDWQPYLDGKTTFDAAISSIVRDVGQPNKATA